MELLQVCIAPRGGKTSAVKGLSLKAVGGHITNTLHMLKTQRSQSKA